jgi:hypothetical protein
VFTTTRFTASFTGGSTHPSFIHSSTDFGKALTDGSRDEEVHIQWGRAPGSGSRSISSAAGAAGTARSWWWRAAAAVAAAVLAAQLL